MSVFVDTSALFAVLDVDDQNHRSAERAWAELVNQRASLVSTNYVLLETFALVQQRLGTVAVRAFQEDVVPVLRVEWVTETQHTTGVTALLTASSRRLSLVDCVSFATMRRLGIKTAFVFDRHFSEQGFVCVPLGVC
ncbi:MAG: PIN domain-containing protein [Anaerolineae bacterium]|nr:PIN domain-containing protein [Anaerolineae bacterium]